MPEAADDKMLCYCRNVRYGVVRKVIAEGDLRSPEQVTAACSAGSGCRSCRPEIEELIAEHRRRHRGLLRWLRRLFPSAGARG
ncbi:MAG: (2Fe-2S)-binding protein [Planctomycetes bacterium]|nr:(2Fe-2S)-binding protein [Planctomycetota bacterium]